MNTTEDLVRRARAGERAAFDALAAPERERLLRFLAGMGVDETSAEDLVQQSLQRAWEKLAQLAEPARFAAWLLAIVVRAGRSHARAGVQRERSGRLDAVPTPIDARRGALTSLVRREVAAELALAVDRLPVLLREAFVLHHLEGLPYPEMAELCDAEVGTLQVRAHRARALLRSQLGSLVDPRWLEEG